MSRFWLPAWTLWQRELVRFFRQRSRVVGALGSPVLFWFLIGSGLGNSFHLPGIEGAASGGEMTYLQYFFPGTVALIILFTAIFSTISIIEDRHEGFLQSVLVAPPTRASVVFGKVAGGATLAFIQGLIFLVLAHWVGISIPWLSWLYLLAVLATLSFGLTTLGFWIAWKLDSTQGFHAIMNLFLIPMWLLSGALFPVSGAPFWLKVVMVLNPLTYGVAALQDSFWVHGHRMGSSLASPLLCFGITFLFSTVLFIMALRNTQKA